MISKNSVRTWNKSQPVASTNLFVNTVPVYSEKHTEPYIQNAELLFLKAAGTFGYHSVLEPSVSGPSSGICPNRLN
jgi:hypothetical protein